MKRRTARERREDLKRYRSTEQAVKNPKNKLRKRLFVANLTNAESDTFCNQTKAYKATFPTVVKDVTACNNARELLDDPYVLDQIEKVIESAGLGFHHRVRVLRDIIFGEAEKEAINLVKDQETGEWLPVQKTITHPSFNERVKAMQLLNQMDGTDKKASAIVDNRNKVLAAMRKKLVKSIENENQENLKNVTEIKAEVELSGDTQELDKNLDEFLTGQKGGDDSKSKAI